MPNLYSFPRDVAETKAIEMAVRLLESFGCTVNDADRLREFFEPVDPKEALGEETAFCVEIPGHRGGHPDEESHDLSLYVKVIIRKDGDLWRVDRKAEVVGSCSDWTM